MPVIDKTIRVNGLDLYVRNSSGDGLPVLMIHGSGASSGVFQKQFESPLADRLHLVALDLPGHGLSANAVDPKASYGIAGITGAITGVLDELGIERAAIYGWSLGGHIAIEVLARTPQRVAGVMVGGMSPVARGLLPMLRGVHASWDMLLASKEVYTPRDVERFAQICFGGSGPADFREQVVRSDGHLRAELFRSMMRGEGSDQRATVEAAEVPIALVNGANEPIARLGYLAGLHMHELWEGKSHVIAGAGHAPFWQAPEAFNAALGRFADDVVLHERQLALGFGRQLEARTA